MSDWQYLLCFASLVAHLLIQSSLVLIEPLYDINLPDSQLLLYVIKTSSSQQLVLPAYSNRSYSSFWEIKFLMLAHKTDCAKAVLSHGVTSLLP